MRPNRIPMDTLAEQLEASCKRNNQNEVSWSGIWFEDCSLVLADYEGFDRDICSEDRRAIVWESINACARRGEVTGKALKSFLERVISKFKKKQLRPFVYVAQMSLSDLERPLTIRYRGATITLSRRLPGKFDRSILERPVRNEQVSPDSQKYSWVRVHISARSSNEAQTGATDVLDFIRGAINYSLIGNTWNDFSSDESRPLNRVLLGPTYTLHEPNGSISGRQYWYDPHFRECDIVKCGDAKWDRGFATLSNMRKQIQLSVYGEDLFRIVIRYCRALDSGEPDIVLLRLWGVLEVLTDGVNDRKETVIRRAASLFRDREIVRATLEVMRKRRNLAAHVGTQGESRRADVVLLHRVVVRAMMLAFQKSRSYSGLEQLGRFLALPERKEDLHEGIRLRRDAMKFRGYN